MANGMAKEAAEGQTDDVLDQVRWQTSLPRLTRSAAERRTAATSQCIRDHVRPEHRHPPPPGGTGFRRRTMRRGRKATAQSYYQLLTGHATLRSFLRDRIAGPRRLESDRCWCNSGARQSCHHLFIERRAWGPQIRTLWRRIGEDCHWEHPMAPALRWLLKEEATGAALGFLESTRVGFRAPAEAARLSVGEGRGGEGAWGFGGSEGGSGPP